MPPALAFFSRGLSVARPAGRGRIAFAILAALHLVALIVLIRTEDEVAGRLAFLCSWGLVNFAGLALLRRPLFSAGLSLLLLLLLILLSQFKQDVLLMTANFVDILLIDSDSIAFLIRVFPNLLWRLTVAGAILVPALILMWWLDPFRVRRRMAALGAAISFAGLAAVSLAVPMDREKAFESNSYVSQFMRSGVVAAVDLSTHGVIDADHFAADRLPPMAPVSCSRGQVLPHIIMVLDESSFDISAIPGVRVPPGYREHFRSFDGKQRGLVVEGAGGPTWYTEYNVLTGLSARSYGRFAEFVTRIAGGRVTRSLPNALHGCGYRSFSLYPWLGAFLGARHFQKSIGIDRFMDAKELGTRDVEPDAFYYGRTADLIRRERGQGPMFVLTYLMANHFPWSYRYRSDLATDWQPPGNGEVNGNSIDEYLRRQEMSARDYKAFVERLRHDFPSEPILIVRFGDHQPLFAKKIVDPALDDVSIGRRIDAADPRYFTTYYAIDALNFRPADLSDARDGLDAAYLPLVVLQAAGIPLDPSFEEQQRVLQNCNGLFYLCAGGAPVRRFNRLLIDAGLMKPL